MIIKPHEFAQAEMSRRVLQIADSFRGIVLSIYAMYLDGKIEHLGSGVVVSLNGRAFLLTASHLVDSGRAADDFILISEKFDSSVSLSRRFLKTKDDDDLAICALTEKDIKVLGASSLEGKLFYSIPPRTKGRGVATIGWPNSKNELSRYKKITPTPMLISGPSLSAEDLGLESEYDQRFAYQRYRSNDCIDESGGSINPTKLNGLSGGLTVDIGNPLDADGLSGNSEVRWHPIGILTDYSKSKRYVRSTRPLRFLRDCFASEDFWALHES